MPVVLVVPLSSIICSWQRQLVLGTMMTGEGSQTSKLGNMEAAVRCIKLL
jgi:hypothetical protein